VRNALILLAVVALAILVMGALNNGTTFEVDYVAGTVSSVSLFWVSAVIAALVVVAGLAAAWFALSGAAGGRRKLEAELQSTYERLREAEALAVRPMPEPERPAPAETAEPEPPAMVEAADAPVLVAEDATLVAGEAAEDATVVAVEARTSLPDEDVTRVAAVAETPAEPDEQTAVTLTGTAPVPEDVAPARVEVESETTDPSAGEPGDEPRPSDS
jgi:hypothetical protein